MLNMLLCAAESGDYNNVTCVAQSGDYNLLNYNICNLEDIAAGTQANHHCSLQDYTLFSSFVNLSILTSADYSSSSSHGRSSSHSRSSVAASSSPSCQGNAFINL